MTKLQKTKFQSFKDNIINKGGFTLLETLLALMILASGILLLTQSWSSSQTKVRKSQLSFEIAALLQRKMYEVEREYSGKPLDGIPEEKEEDFGSDYPEYKWKLKSRDLEIPDLTGSLTAKSGGSDEMMITLIKQMTDHISSSVKEVQVTIIYTGGKKPVEYSATQYIVNFDKQITPGAAVGQ